MGTHPGLALRSIVDCLQASLISIATLTHTFLYRQKSLRLIGEDYTIPYLRYCTTRTALLRERGENVEKLIVHYLRTTHLTRKTVVRSISSGPLRQTDRYISVHAHGVMTTPESNEMATLPPPAEQPTATTTTTTSTTATTASTHTPIAASMASASENT